MTHTGMDTVTRKRQANNTLQLPLQSRVVLNGDFSRFSIEKGSRFRSVIKHGPRFGALAVS
jgi:hypothetical protein